MRAGRRSGGGVPRRLAHLSDEALVALVARGEEAALAELYDRHGRAAYALALRVLRERTLAEDAVQDAFLALWRDAVRFVPERARATAWLMTLVHRRAVDLVRREQRRRGEPLAPDAAGGEVGSAADSAWLRLEREHVQEALARLPDQQREVTRARLLRRFHAVAAGRAAGPAARHDQESDVQRARRDAFDAGLGGDGGAVDDELMHELTAAYAVDALEPDERSAYEEHLGRCPRCQEELAAFAPVTTSLALAVPPAEPSSRLRSRIVAAAGAERRRPVRRRPRWAYPAAGLAAAASCAAIGLGVRLATVHPPAPSTIRALALHGAAGSLVVSRDGSAVLVVSGLAPAPPGKTYEIWVLQSGRAARGAGLFGGGPRTVRVRLTRPVGPGRFVGVTLERAGGVAAPTAPPILTSEPA